ncbi:DUF2252 domain-containing protein [Subtercola endophyticus]|uniref:DUF2252 domain-containing protein n=1 Tax=Subtercola endophyticus TaxID=2895559 RepID=UPI001E30594A|nr:DUF2252 domain-containing protein [Subtercola endophyticus]UFS59554.1 DUF2252 domain-containing protein [Subtercola endophyticus]
MSFELRAETGKNARIAVPRAAHAGWSASPDRADPVALLEEQAGTRVPELVPIRYGRMMVSPLTFYRGAALIMASDLSHTPNSGITVQLCGDAHLSNFGLFASAERSMIFDINDFDETLPGPWEWDVKRLAASFEITSRYRGFSDADRTAITLEVTRAYREQMRKSAESGVMKAWYDRLDVSQLEGWVRSARQAKEASKKQVKRTTDVVAKARTKDSMTAFSKLVGLVDGHLRILASAPLIVPIEDLVDDTHTREVDEEAMKALIAAYQTTLISQNHPIREYSYRHMARKVVGVGSVGTRAWILLFQGRNQQDPLILQAKEANESVLARFVGASAYENQGERVVRGQRLMQSSSDIFLGWQRVTGIDGAERDFYVRQLHDWKGSVDVETLRASGAKLYAKMCGETLARAHARAGDRVAIAAYLGASDRFDQAIAAFATDYADQNQRDYDAFVAAVESGRLYATPGL